MRSIAFVASLILASLALVGCAHDTGDATAMKVDPVARSLTIRAVVHPAQFEGGPNVRHHLLTWAGGRRSGNALFVTPVSDSQVLEALKGLGAVPANNLTRATWEKLGDPKAKDPDFHAEGPAVAMTITWKGLANPLALKDLFVDGKVDLRFTGNGALIAVWRSGCIVCMQSCPGAKVPNAPYTMREWKAGKGQLQVKPNLLPPEGTEVTVTLRLVE